MDPESVRLSIEGMMCDHCAVGITKALENVEGVKSAVVSYAGKTAVVEIDGRAQANDLVAAVASAGRYTARVASAPSPSSPRTSSVDRAADLVIIGGGSAAFAAAIRAADLGASATIVEAGTMGGTCVNVGCVPSKTMIRAAERLHGASRSAFAGMSLSARLVDYAATVRQKDALVTDLRKAKYADVLAAYPSVSYRQGTARFVPGGLTIDGESAHAAKIVVATGARAWEPPIPGLADTPHWNSTDALAATTLPAHLVVIGAGAVGIEIAQMMFRMGSAVTLLEALPGVVPSEDADVQLGLAAALREEGMRVEVGVAVARVGGRPGAYEIAIDAGKGGEIVRADALLVATGRRANTASLGLAEAGVRTNERGAIVVDDYQRTSNRDVYAAGDVTGDPMFVYVSAHTGSVAAENALFGDRVRRDLVGMPRVTFTDPAVASVGWTEDKARRSGSEVVVSKLGLEHVPRAIAARDTRGFVKLVVDAGSRLLLGAHVLAPEAGEMIQECVMAIRHGITVDEIIRAMHPYLTHAEAIKLAAQALGKDVSKLSCCAA